MGVVIAMIDYHEHCLPIKMSSSKKNSILQKIGCGDRKSRKIWVW
jgi:hypothetical protein